MRFNTQTPTGKLTLNRQKIRKEELLDGKFLVSSSDDMMTAEEIVTGYKALWRVERAFRDLKHVLDIRPVYHRLRVKSKICCKSLRPSMCTNHSSAGDGSRFLF